MTYALMYDVPADEQMYHRVKTAIGDQPADGLVARLVLKTDSGLRHIGVWESRQDWQRYRDERIDPALHTVLSEAGFTEMPPPPPIEELALVDVAIGG
jgi:hypothetical protein